jgi:hypothetical protein
MLAFSVAVATKRELLIAKRRARRRFVDIADIVDADWARDRGISASGALIICRRG